MRALPWWCAADAVNEPRQFLAACPKALSTPLVNLGAFARELRLGAVFVKDETGRLGLGSFKALGGSYAVLRIAERRAAAALSRLVRPDEILSAEVRATLSDLTICCASDGNHGRSVAAGCRLIGARCVVFLHEGVSDARTRCIADLGAEVVRVEGDYQDSVALAAATAATHRWSLVADTAPPEAVAEAEACGFVMQGYTIIVDEILAQVEAAAITHVFVQAGVGGLAASVFGHWHARLAGQPTPRFIVVEPDRSACLMESARLNAPVRLAQSMPTVMAMLECQSPSLLAWPVISALADAFMTVSEDEALAAVEALARPHPGDLAMRVGESGAAGLAGLLRAALPANREALGLDEHSQVLVIATERSLQPAAWTGISS